MIHQNWHTGQGDSLRRNVLRVYEPMRNCLIGLGKMADRQSRTAAPAPTTRAPASRPPEDPDSGLVSSTVKYLLRTEVHTFAFSVAANAILSFFPFVLLLMTLIRRVFHSPAMYDVVVQLLRDLLAGGTGLRDSQSECAGGRAPSRPGGFAAHSSGHFNRNLHAARSGAEPHLGISQQPFLFRQPADLARPGV